MTPHALTLTLAEVPGKTHSGIIITAATSIDRDQLMVIATALRVKSRSAVLKKGRTFTISSTNNTG